MLVGWWVGMEKKTANFDPVFWTRTDLARNSMFVAAELTNAKPTPPDESLAVTIVAYWRPCATGSDLGVLEVDPAGE